jgi:hypothetical protein
MDVVNRGTHLQLSFPQKHCLHLPLASSGHLCAEEIAAETGPHPWLLLQEIQM